jgi:hypothetical protein
MNKLTRKQSRPRVGTNQNVIINQSPTTITQTVGTTITTYTTGLTLSSDNPDWFIQYVEPGQQIYPYTRPFAYSVNQSNYQYYANFYDDTTQFGGPSIKSVLIGSDTIIPQLQILFNECTIVSNALTTTMTFNFQNDGNLITSSYIFMTYDASLLSVVAINSGKVTITSMTKSAPSAEVQASIRAQSPLINARCLGITCTSLESSPLVLTFYTGVYTVNWSTETMNNKLFMGNVDDTTFINRYTNSTDGTIDAPGTDEKVVPFSPTDPTDAALYPLVGQIWVGYNPSIPSTRSMQIINSTKLPINIVINPTEYGKIKVVNTNASIFTVTVTVNSTVVASSDGTFLLAPPPPPPPPS